MPKRKKTKRKGDPPQMKMLIICTIYTLFMVALGMGPVYSLNIHF